MVENSNINLQFVFIYEYSLLNNVNNLILISIYHVLTKDNYFSKNVKSSSKSKRIHETLNKRELIAIFRQS